MPSEAGIADCRVSECDRKTVPRCGTRNRKCSTAVCGQSVTWYHKCVLLSRPEALPWHDSADWDDMVQQIVRCTVEICNGMCCVIWLACRRWLIMPLLDASLTCTAILRSQWTASTLLKTYSATLHSHGSSNPGFVFQQMFRRFNVGNLLNWNQEYECVFFI